MQAKPSQANSREQIRNQSLIWLGFIYAKIMAKQKQNKNNTLNSNSTQFMLILTTFTRSAIKTPLNFPCLSFFGVMVVAAAVAVIVVMVLMIYSVKETKKQKNTNSDNLTLTYFTFKALQAFRIRCMPYIPFLYTLYRHINIRLELEFEAKKQTNNKCNSDVIRWKTAVTWNSLWKDKYMY